MSDFQKPLWILFLLLAASLSLFGQAKRSEISKYEVKWNEGEITMADGSKISGRVFFNDNEGIVMFQNEDEVQSFTSNHLLGFQFYDAAALRNHVFIVMEFTDPQEGIAKLCFFEILKEFKSFAVLAKIDRIGTEIQRGALRLPTSKAINAKTGNNIVASQTETIYFMSEDGDLQPYLQIIEIEREGEWFDQNRTKNRFVDKDLFEKHTRPFYEDLTDFAKSNDLSFKRKSHLIKILDQYEYLLSH